MSVNDRLIKTELAKHEAVIERGMKTTIEVGLSMKAIRDQKLYEGEYKTFENYVNKRWGYSRPRAYQLIEAAEVDANLSTMVDIDRPKGERQLREVGKAPPEKQAEVVKKAVEKAAEENRKPTAKDYKKAVKQVTGELLDVTGEPVVEPKVSRTPMSQDEQAKANRKLAKDYIAKAVNAVDDYHSSKPNKQRRADVIKLLQQAGENLW